MAIVKQLGAKKSPVTWGRALGMDGSIAQFSCGHNIIIPLSPVSRQYHHTVILPSYIGVSKPAGVNFLCTKAFNLRLAARLINPISPAWPAQRVHFPLQPLPVRPWDRLPGNHEIPGHLHHSPRPRGATLKCPCRVISVLNYRPALAFP